MEGTLRASFFGKIAVGPKFRRKEPVLTPVINDIDWNKFPSHCSCLQSQSVISSASGAGTGIFKLVSGLLPEQCRWMASGEEAFVKLYQSDVADGETSAVKFHPLDGRVLATGSVTGKIRLILYSDSTLEYAVVDTYEHTNKISSLAWHPGGKYLIASLQPSSRLVFLRLLPVAGVPGDKTMSSSLGLRYMGLADIPGCPQDSDVSILFHPKEYLLTCAKQSEYITIWNLQATTTEIWKANRLMKCGTGVICMSIDQSGEFLTTLQKGDIMKIWSFNIEDSCRIQLSKALYNEHKESTRAGQTSRQIKTHSCASAVDCSRDFHIVTAGSDKDIISNTLLVYKNVATHHPVDHSVWAKACELTASPAPVEQINCVKFNPNQEQDNISLSTGGGCGFIHLWALSDEPLNLPALDSRDEHYYYNGSNGRTRKELENLLPSSVSVSKVHFVDKKCKIKFRNDEFSGMIHAIRNVPFDELPSDTPEGMDGQMQVDDVRDDGGSTEDETLKEVNRRLRERKEEADRLRDLLIAQSVGFFEDLKADFGSRADTFRERMHSEVEKFRTKFELDNMEIVSIIEPAYKDVSDKLTNVATKVHDANKSARTKPLSEDLQSFLESMSQLLSKPDGAEKSS